MRKRRRVCDVCGEDEEHREFMTGEFDDWGEFETSMRKYDLCPDCAAGAAQWLDRKKSDPEMSGISFGESCLAFVRTFADAYESEASWGEVRRLAGNLADMLRSKDDEEVSVHAKTLRDVAEDDPVSGSQIAEMCRWVLLAGFDEASARLDDILP